MTKAPKVVSKPYLFYIISVQSTTLFFPNQLVGQPVGWLIDFCAICGRLGQIHPELLSCGQSTGLVHCSTLLLFVVHICIRQSIGQWTDRSFSACISSSPPQQDPHVAGGGRHGILHKLMYTSFQPLYKPYLYLLPPKQLSLVLVLKAKHEFLHKLPRYNGCDCSTRPFIRSSFWSSTCFTSFSLWWLCNILCTTMLMLPILPPQGSSSPSFSPASWSSQEEKAQYYSSSLAGSHT